MSDTSNSTEPATSQGTTRAAGTGTSDEQFARKVADQTDPNLDAQDVFDRESSGTSTDKSASDSDADDVR